MTTTLQQSIQIEQTEKALERALAYYKIAKKAMKKFHAKKKDLEIYDRDSLKGLLWTVAETKDEIQDKALTHLAAYHHCMAKYQMYLRQVTHL